MASVARAIEQQIGKTRKTERAAGLCGSAHLLVPAFRPTGVGSRREFTRKVRTPSGNYQLLQLVPWSLTDANPVRFELFSQKLLRLRMPFALAVAPVTSVLLVRLPYRVAFGLHVAFYALSPLARVRLKWGSSARLADAAFTLVALNTGTAVVSANFISARKAVWGR